MLQRRHGRRADDGLGLGAQQAARHKDAAAFLRQQPRVGDTVGDVVGVQRRAVDNPRHGQRGGPGVQVDEIVGPDERGGGLRDGGFLADGQRFLGFHRGLVSAELPAGQRGTAVYLIDEALPVELQQVTPDG